MGETACPATIQNGLRLREVVGDFREAPSWGSAFPGGGGWYAALSAPCMGLKVGDVEALGEAAWAAEGFVHAAGFGGAAAIWAGRVGVGGGDEAELVEHMGGAVFVGTDIKGFFRAEDLIGQRLEGFEKFVDAGVECAGLAGGKHFSGCAVGEPEVDGGADERGGAGGGPDE